MSNKSSIQPHLLSLKYAFSIDSFFFKKKKTSRAVPPLADRVKILNCWPLRERKNGINQGGGVGEGGGEGGDWSWEQRYRIAKQVKNA